MLRPKVSEAASATAFRSSWGSTGLLSAANAPLLSASASSSGHQPDTAIIAALENNARTDAMNSSPSTWGMLRSVMMISMLFFKYVLKASVTFRGEIDVVTHSLEEFCQDDPIGRFVFDDEYACHDADRFPRRWGGERLGEYAVGK